ncbi:MAG TPA: DUF4331 family protein [Polyangia bacterium]|nr:DUF4331 family protein [Polyangia bacterium]
MSRRRRSRFALGGIVLALGVGIAWRVIAASHDDGPTVTATPAAELTDVYAWMTSDKTKVNLVMNVYPNAGTATFSSQILYVFHVNSTTAFGTTGTQTKIICGFDATQTITCWVGDTETVTGNAATSTGLVSASGKTRVFAGLRDDPSFFNQTGFADFASTVTSGIAPGSAPDCPPINAGISAALVQLLRSSMQGAAAAANNFVGQNVLSIVIQVDTTLVTTGGKILGVWASTHQRG